MATKKTKVPTLESFGTKATKELTKKRSDAARRLKIWNAKMEKDKIKASVQFAPELSGIEMSPTGLLSLDFLLGGHSGQTGGIPMGVHSLLGGKPGCGKSTLAALIEYHWTTIGKVVHHALNEPNWDPVWITKMFSKFVDEYHKEGDEWKRITGNLAEEHMLDYLQVGQYQDLDVALDSVLNLLDEHIVDGIVIDTINGKGARKSIQDKSGNLRELSKETMAPIPQLLSRYFQRVGHHLRTENIPLLLIGQVRADLGNTFRVTDYIPGGNAMQHSSRLTIMQRRGKTLKNTAGDRIGFEVVWSIQTAQIGHGIQEGDIFRTAFFSNKGFDPVFEVLNVSEYCGLLQPGHKPDGKISKSILEYIDSNGEVVNLKGSKASMPTTLLKSLKNAKPIMVTVKGIEKAIPAWEDMYNQLMQRLKEIGKENSTDPISLAKIPLAFGAIEIEPLDISDEEDKLTQEELELVGNNTHYDKDSDE